MPPGREPRRLWPLVLGALALQVGCSTGSGVARLGLPRVHVGCGAPAFLAGARAMASRGVSAVAMAAKRLAGGGHTPGSDDESDDVFTGLRRSEAQLLDAAIDVARGAEEKLVSLRRRHHSGKAGVGGHASVQDVLEGGATGLYGAAMGAGAQAEPASELASRLPEWSALEVHADMLRDLHLRDLVMDEARARALTLEHDGIVLDLTRNRVTEETVARLLDLARAAGLEAKVRAMVGGEPINLTEDRPVLHLALRRPKGAGESLVVDGEDVLAQIHEVRDRVDAFARALRAGEHRGATGKRLKNFIVVGIGGSSLGPSFLYEALKATKLAAELGDRTVRFLANIDEVDTARAIHGLDPAETLVIITSKSFRTRETLINGCTLREWLVEGLQEGSVSEADVLAKHVAACTCEPGAALAWGVSRELTFEFWDWVGGRYSVTSSVGQLPIALAFGPESFASFLEGAASVDDHFVNAPLEANLPVLMGLVGIWNTNFQDHRSRAIFPYCEALWRLPAHVQQVDMESNGKRVTRVGEKLDYCVGEVCFGEPGTTGQHSFFQLLHMGQVVPADFIGFVATPHPMSHETVHVEGSQVSHHDELMANFFAQPDALALGCQAHELRAQGVPEHLIAHRTFPGDRPSNCLLLPRLTPYTVGQILALYEHRTAVQGFVWGLNSFDQWGVELGKNLAADVREQIVTARRTGGPALANVPATASLLQRYLSLQSEALEDVVEEDELPSLASPRVRACMGETPEDPCPLEM